MTGDSAHPTRPRKATTVKKLIATAGIVAVSALALATAPTAAAGPLFGDVTLNSPSTATVTGASTAIDSTHTITYTNRSGKNLHCTGLAGSETVIGSIQLAENLAANDQTHSGQMLLLSGTLSLEMIRTSPDSGWLYDSPSAQFLPQGGEEEWADDQTASRTVAAGTAATWTFTSPVEGPVGALIYCADSKDTNATYVEVEFSTTHAPVDTGIVDAITDAQLGSLAAGMGSLQGFVPLG